METKLTLKIERHDLAQIVGSVFETMMSLAVAESSDPWFSSGERLTAAVHLAGEWNGAVLLECDRSQACQFAGRFLSIDPPETVDDLVRDTMGELANMIGGNLKCVVSHGMRLSSPAVVDGSDYGMRICGVEFRDQLAFACEYGIFWVTVLIVPPKE